MEKGVFSTVRSGIINSNVTLGKESRVSDIAYHSLLKGAGPVRPVVWYGKRRGRNLCPAKREKYNIT